MLGNSRSMKTPAIMLRETVSMQMDEMQYMRKLHKERGQLVPSARISFVLSTGISFASFVQKKWAGAPA